MQSTKLIYMAKAARAQEKKKKVNCCMIGP